MRRERMKASERKIQTCINISSSDVDYMREQAYQLRLKSVSAFIRKLVQEHRENNKQG